MTELKTPFQPTATQGDGTWWANRDDVKSDPQYAEKRAVFDERAKRMQEYLMRVFAGAMQTGYFGNKELAGETDEDGMPLFFKPMALLMYLMAFNGKNPGGANQFAKAEQPAFGSTQPSITIINIYGSGLQDHHAPENTFSGQGRELRERESIVSTPKRESSGRFDTVEMVA